MVRLSVLSTLFISISIKKYTLYIMIYLPSFHYEKKKQAKEKNITRSFKTLKHVLLSRGKIPHAGSAKEP